MEQPRGKELFGPERALAFSDGVFAVAITLLVIDLRLPETVHGDAETLNSLRAMGPKLLIFAFTFLIVGINWLRHHRKFSYVQQIDNRLLWLNLLYLLTLCLVPFATGVLSEQSNVVGFILYSGVMALTCLLSSALAAYGLQEQFVGAARLPPRMRQDMIMAPLATAMMFLLAAGLSLAGYTQAGTRSLLLIIPISLFLGVRARRTK